MRYTNGFLRESPSGKWVGVLKYKDPAGEWRQVTKTLSADRAEAERMLAEWHDLMEGPRGPAGAPARGGGRSVEQAVRGCLAAQLARGRIERSTHDTQLAYAERCIFPELGAVPIGLLSPADVQEWADRLCLRMSPGSARIPYSTLRKSCQKAAREGEIPSSPFGSVEPPARARPSRAYLPPASVELLERAAGERWGPAHPFACAVDLALLAGLRAGECCGLRWRDVSGDAGRLRVASSIGRSSGGCYVKGPKNPSSARELPVVSGLTRSLLARRRAAGGGEPPDGSWFVCGERGSFSDPHRLSIAFAALCRDAGVTDSEGGRATFHELRHTFATRAVRAGVDARTLADLMGHADAGMTLNVYAASGEDAKLAAVARLDAALGGG